MFSKQTAAILLILLLIVVTVVWSKLRFVDEADHEPQRWRIDEHPAFQQQKDLRKPDNSTGTNSHAR